MTIKLKDAELKIFNLEEFPHYWVSGDVLHVNAALTHQEYQLADVEEITFGGQTGAALATSGEKLEVWPNPTTEAVMISGASGVATFVDANGKTVLTAQTGTLIDVSTLPMGIYQVRINGRTIKLMKK